MEAKMLLRDPEIFPSDKVLNDVLGDDVYSALESFIGTITGNEYGLNVEWRYYNDGKSWLGKVEYKKKTTLWLSIWDGFFKASFFFTEKHLEAINALEISEIIKDEFAGAKPIGRLMPMLIEVRSKEQLEDLLSVVRLKKSLK